jgi:hypothetical protein
MSASSDLLQFAKERRFATILADPPWQFQNKTGKVAPEHRRLSRYATMTLREASRRAIDGRDGASLSLGAERASARRTRRDEGVRLRL